MPRLITATVFVLAAGVASAQQAPGGHFIENWDLDGDGQVSLSEVQERRGDVFYSFDADDDGFLNAEEYAVFDEARANDMAGQPDHAKGAMQAAADGMQLRLNDANGDGKVSRDEFIGASGEWVGRMDRNGDGRVTGDDFQPQGNAQAGNCQGQGNGNGMGETKCQGNGAGMGKGMAMSQGNGQGQGHGKGQMQGQHQGQGMGQGNCPAGTDANCKRLTN